MVLTQETHAVGGSRGQANFVFKCRMCKRESNAVIKLTGKPYTGESKKRFIVAEIDSRGLDFIEFMADVSGPRDLLFNSKKF